MLVSEKFNGRSKPPFSSRRFPWFKTLRARHRLHFIESLRVSLSELKRRTANRTKNNYVCVSTRNSVLAGDLRV